MPKMGENVYFISYVFPKFPLPLHMAAFKHFPY